MHDSQLCTYLHISYYKIFHDLCSPVASEAGADSSWLTAADCWGRGKKGGKGGQKGEKKTLERRKS